MAITYKNLLKQNHEGEKLTISHTSWIHDGPYAKNVNHYECWLGTRSIPKTVATELLGTYQHKQVSYHSIYGNGTEVYLLLRKTD